MNKEIKENTKVLLALTRYFGIKKKLSEIDKILKETYNIKKWSLSFLCELFKCSGVVTQESEDATVSLVCRDNNPGSHLTLSFLVVATLSAYRSCHLSGVQKVRWSHLETLERNSHKMTGGKRWIFVLKLVTGKML